MSHFSPKPGFTLAELLIALALLGIITAFTIPKVLQSSAEQEKVAKLRETVSTLENAWYNVRATNSMASFGTLWDNTQGQINAALSTNAYVFGANELYDGVAHPCTAIVGPGYYQFQNGVVVMGVHFINYNGVLPPSSVQNSPLCIDLNGPALPNEPGQDVFAGDFNPWGDFDTQNPDTSYTPGPNNRAFLWGNSTVTVRHMNGLNLPAPMNTGESRVGYWLVR